MARARTFVRLGPQRQFIWSDVLLQASGTVAAGAKSTGSLSALGMFASGVTLIRTRGRVVATMITGAISDVTQYGIAIGIFSSDAFAAGVASLPGPLMDADYDWLWYLTGAFGPSLAGTEDERSMMTTISLELDSKAMRKLKPNQMVGFVAEAVAFNGAVGIDFSVSAC